MQAQRITESLIAVVGEDMYDPDDPVKVLTVMRHLDAITMPLIARLLYAEGRINPRAILIDNAPWRLTRDPAVIDATDYMDNCEHCVRMKNLARKSVDEDPTAWFATVKVTYTCVWDR